MITCEAGWIRRKEGDEAEDCVLVLKNGEVVNFIDKDGQAYNKKKSPWNFGRLALQPQQEYLTR